MPPPPTTTRTDTHYPYTTLFRSPLFRSNIQLISAVRILPTCRLPVGEGAKRVVTVTFFLPIVSRNTPPRRAQGFYGINRFVLSRRSERVRDGITTVAAEIARAQLPPRRSLATVILGEDRTRVRKGRSVSELVKLGYR